MKQSTRSYWSFAAGLLAVAFAVHYLQSEPQPAPAEPARDESAVAAPVANPSRPAPPPGAPPDELARSVVGALPQGEREAQRLQALEVEALVRSGRVGSARAQAAAYYERWPGGPDTAELERLTGAHPRVDQRAE